MPDTLQPQSLTSYINEIRKMDPVRKPVIIVTAKAQTKIVASKKSEPSVLPDPLFEKWNLPPEAEGYIRCNRYDFL